MTEAEVRAAIVKDFGPDAVIRTAPNLAEHTQVLAVRVPDVLPEGGTAEVSYVLGYKGHKLFQINVLWSKATDPAVTPDRLLANAESLKTYFAGAGYNPATVTMNEGVSNGLLIFRGNDADNHTTALLLQGALAPGSDKNAATFNPSSLLLLYFQDSKHPDVFKIAPGKF